MLLNRAPRWDKHRSIFLKLGFIFSLSIAFMAFNFTSDMPQEEVYIEPTWEEGEIEMTPPVTRERKALPPPPEPKVIVDPVVVPVETPTFTELLVPDEPVIDDEPTSDTNIEDYKPEVKKVAPVLPPPPKEEEAPMLIAERMPVYTTCDLSMTEADRRVCTQKAMLADIYKHLKYPQMAREVGIKGMVVVSFVVDKNGHVGKVSIVKDIGGGCGAEVVRVIHKLGTFHAGRQNGKPVSVIYRVPVKFDLKD